jgi:hypothetical protein
MSENGKSPDYDKRFGLDISFEEALQRFANATKDELEEAAGEEGDLVADGATELVPFKGVHQTNSGEDSMIRSTPR